MDTLARVTALLDRAETDGGKVISITAIRRALTGEADPPTDVHILAMTAGRWHMRHPDTCPISMSCPVVASAHRTLAATSYADGEYEAWVGRSGWLCTQVVQP